MKKEERRDDLLASLRRSCKPLSGSMLAKKYGVSRQIIVQDIALLRALNHRIISTYKGYMLNDDSVCKRTLKVRHSDEEIKEELYCIVDEGGRVLDVFIKHEAYGMIKADLYAATRNDVDEFVRHIKSRNISPLKNLTDWYHYHTIEADSEETLDRIEKILGEKQFLL